MPLRWWKAVWSVSGGISVFAAILLAWISTWEPSVGRDVASALSSAVLAIGALQILAEATLQEKLASGILGQQRAGETRVLERLDQSFDSLTTALRLDHGLAPSGLTSVERTRGTWAAVIDGEERLDVLPVDPATWLVHNWPEVLDAVRSRPLHVTVHLPNVNSMADETLHALATRAGSSPDGMKQQFASVVDELKNTWTAATPAAGARLEIWTYNKIPGYGLVFGEHGWALLLPPAAGGTALSGTVVATFVGGTDPEFLAWATRQPAALESSMFDRVA